MGILGKRNAGNLDKSNARDLDKSNAGASPACTDFKSNNIVNLVGVGLASTPLLDALTSHRAEAQTILYQLPPA